MTNYAVQDRTTGEFVHYYGADIPDHFDTFPLEQYNHIPQIEVVEVVRRRVSKLEFVTRLGDAAFTKLLELSLSSIEIMKFVKLIDWATAELDGTSIDLDDPRVQKVAELEPVLISLGVVEAGWAAEVLA